MKKVLLLLIISAYTVFSQIQPPASGCYHAAFTGNDSHAQFVALAGKDIAIEMFFTGWPSNKLPDFPSSKCTQIHNNGSIPHITWMIYTSGTTYPLDAVINGSYDSYISGYADQVKSWEHPLFIRLGHEFNGDWYPYGGANNGGGTLNGFGDPALPDGPERFIAAYKHVYDIFKNRGVQNVTWIWCPNNGSTPDQSWNDPVNYYPGDAYVDWIGLDGYNFGRSQTWSGWLDFWHVYANESGKGIYQKFESYNKPMMIAEFASVETGGSKSDWISKAYNLYLKYSFPKIKAVTWFHVRKLENGVDTDWRINSSESALQAYKDAIADPYYVASVVTDVKPSETVPSELSLMQNYPNPFNPETTIKYSIPSVETRLPAGQAGRGVSLHTTITVYDMLGREVATLVNETKSPGTYEVKFNAENLAAGIYVYTLRYGGRMLNGKMTLLK